MASSTVAHPQDELSARLGDHLDRKEVRFVVSTAEELARIDEAIEETSASFAAFFAAEVSAGVDAHGDQAPLPGHPYTAAELRALLRRFQADGTLRYAVAGLVGEELGMTRTGGVYAW